MVDKKMAEQKNKNRKKCFRKENRGKKHEKVKKMASGKKLKSSINYKK